MNQENQPPRIGTASSPLEKLDRSLSEVFGTATMKIEKTLPANVIDAPVKVIAEEVDLDSVAPDDEKVDVDAEFARTNMHDLIATGKDAIEYALELAKESDNPRAFEVVFAGLKHISDMNSQLLDIHQKKNAAKGIKGGPKEGPQKVVNNAVFVGSTQELNRMLEQMDRGN